LVKGSREQEVADCVCSETFKAKIKIARFAILPGRGQINDKKML
jgi:hypothetical protein